MNPQSKERTKVCHTETQYEDLLQDGHQVLRCTAWSYVQRSWFTDIECHTTGIDTIVSCVGRAGIEKQIKLITWAEQAGVRRFFTSEYGTDIEYWPESAQEPPHQLKLKVRAHMKTMKRLEHTYLVTGP